jgi:hypothetical protein
MKDRVCTYCGYVGKPTTQGLGSFFVDAFIWLVVSSVVLMSGILPLLIIPVGWTIYHIVKYGTTTCPKCENLDMVSLNSTKGKAVLQHEKGMPAPWSDDNIPVVK